MKNKLYILSTLSAIALSISACDMNNSKQQVENMPDGKYEETSTVVDASGTKTKKTISSDVKTDDEGNRKAVVKSKVTQDPKGLLNKTTVSKTKDVTEEEDGAVTTSYEHEENKPRY